MDETPRNNQTVNKGPTARPNKEAERNPDRENQGPDGKETALNARANRERVSPEIDARIQEDTAKIANKQM